MQLEVFLEKENENLKELNKELLSTAWMVTITGEEEWNKKLEQAQNDLNSYFSDSERFQQVQMYRGQKDLQPLQRRQLDDLYHHMVKHQLDEETLSQTIGITNEIVHIFNTFRPMIEGKTVTNNDILDILKKSKDHHERKKAWLASKQVGKKIESKILDLVHKRNAEARALGFENYYQMIYETEELDLDSVFKTFQRLVDLSTETYTRVKQEIDQELAEKMEIHTDDLRPWHYVDPFFQKAPPVKGLDLDSYYKDKNLEQLTRDTFHSIGLDISDILQKSDLYPRKNKYPFGYCTDIDREGDIRVLVNIDSSEFWMTTMLHEFGHAAYFKYIDRDLPFMLRRHAHTLTTEAIAQLCERLNKNPIWLERFLGVETEQVQKCKPSIEKLLQRQILVQARWIITFTFFERELYENPHQDLNKRWWELVQQIQLLHPPEETHHPDWASKMHFSLAPVSYQNYLLGECTASQLQTYIETHISQDLFTPEVGKYLKDHFFTHGARWTWNEKIEKATGEPLNPRFFIEQFIG